jgi:hypothetical protein
MTGHGVIMNRFVAELSELQLRCRAGFAGAQLPLPVAKQQWISDLEPHRFEFAAAD